MTIAEQAEPARRPTRAAWRRAGTGLWVIVIAGLVLRLAPVLQAPFPFGDGGLYHAYIRDLEASGLVPPLTTSYNGGIAFPYPFLAFELVAIASSVTGIEPLVFLRFLPPILSTLAIVAFAWLAQGILREKSQVLVGTFLFATLPEAYQNSILGGGITKSLAVALVLVALGVGVRAMRTGTPRGLALCGVLIGLAQLAHPYAGPASAIGLLFIVLLVGPSRRRIAGYLGAGVLAILVASPWWLRVLVAAGPEPLLSAASGSSDPVLGIVAQSYVLLVSSGLPLLAAACWVATAAALLRPSRTLIVLGGWSLVVAAIDQRNAYLSFPVPAALFGAAGVASVAASLRPTGVRFRGWTRRSRPFVGGALMALAAVAVAIPLVVPGITGPRDPLREPDLAAARAVETLLPPGTRVLVITGVPWYADDISEWLPALTTSISVATPQGTEWAGPGVFARTVAAHEEAQGCADEGVPCVEAWGVETGVAFDAIYVAGPEGEPSRQPEPTIPELLRLVPTTRDDCCGPLRESLLAEPRWRVVYDADGAILAIRT